MKNKTLLITLVFALFLLCVVIANPVAAETGNKIGNTTVEALSGGNIEVNDNTATITVSANDVNNLEWHPAKENGIERPANGWWIGFKLTFNESVKDKNVQSTYTNYLGESKGPQSITLDLDDEKNYSCWIAINENVINALKNDSKKTFATFNFTCSEPEMNFNVIVNISDPGNVKLKTSDEAVKVTVDGTSFTMEKREVFK